FLLLFSLCFLILLPPPCSTLFPYTTLFRSCVINIVIFSDTRSCLNKLFGSLYFIIISTKTSSHIITKAIDFFWRNALSIKMRSEENKEKRDDFFHALINIMLLQQAQIN